MLSHLRYKNGLPPALYPINASNKAEYPIETAYRLILLMYVDYHSHPLKGLID